MYKLLRCSYGVADSLVTSETVVSGEFNHEIIEATDVTSSAEAVPIFYLRALESTFTKMRRPSLCRQKEFVCRPKIVHRAWAVCSSQF